MDYLLIYRIIITELRFVAVLKALIAMSGGVDSSVAALLMLHKGYQCIGVTMKLISDDITQNHFPETECPRACCSIDDADDAKRVALKLGFPHYVFNFTDAFQMQVIDRFVSFYEEGLTPNPCLDCNRYLKFDLLLQRALELRCDKIVTGHYARIQQQNGRYLLLKGSDPAKDQSYVLFYMTQEQLSHTCFPLGTMHKEQIRRIAASNGFINAEKPDSQDICFVPDGDYVRFMESYTGHSYPEGLFIDPEGNTLGTHKGAVRYTIGQRKGLGVAFGHPMYVLRKDMTKNTITLAEETDLYSDNLTAEDTNWISFERLKESVRAMVKIRYRAKEQPAWLIPLSDDKVRVEFDEPQRAVTKGQAAVFYQEDEVIGGGRIL